MNTITNSTMNTKTNSTMHSKPRHWDLDPDDTAFAVRADDCEYGAMYSATYGCWLAVYLPSGEPESLTVDARARLTPVGHYYGGTLTEVCAAVDLAYPMKTTHTMFSDDGGAQ